MHKKKTTTDSFRAVRSSWVMSLAAFLQDEYSLDQSTALKKAHATFDLLQSLRIGVVQFAYTKDDGTFRRARGTLKKGIDPVFDNYEHKDVRAKRDNNNTEGIYTYWDLDRHGFRCFKANNLVCYE